MAKMRSVPTRPTASASVLARTEAKSHWCMSVHRRFAAHRQASLELARQKAEGGEADEEEQCVVSEGLERPEKFLGDIVCGEQQVGIGYGGPQRFRLHELDRPFHEG